jgi:hypothetical protein
MVEEGPRATHSQDQLLKLENLRGSAHQAYQIGSWVEPEAKAAKPVEQVLKIEKPCPVRFSFAWAGGV